MRGAAVFHADAPLESDAVDARRAQVRGRIEIALRALREAFDRIRVQLHQGGRIDRRTVDARAGDVVRLRGEPLRLEYLAAGLHQAGVVVVDVADEEPRADALFRQVQAFGGQKIDIIVQDALRLGIRIRPCGDTVAGPEMPQAVRLDDGQARRAPHLRAAHQIEPHGRPVAVERRLPDMRDRAGLRPDRFRPEGAVIQEVALENRFPAAVGGPEFCFGGIKFRQRARFEDLVKLLHYSVRLISTIWKPSIMSPSLMSL